MKPQDIIFILILIILLYKRKVEWFVYAGLACLIVSTPLFYFQIFFTAQRLTYYAVAFFTTAVLIYIFKLKKS